MKIVKKIEKLVEEWIRPLPRLPKSAQKWVAINIWWLQLVGVVVLAISGVGILATLSLALNANTAVFDLSNLGGITMPIISIISLVSMLLNVIVMGMAVSPLKSFKRKGWDLLFIAVLINCFSVFLSAITRLSFSAFVSSVFSGAVIIIISTYLLFEIRSFFVSTK